MRFREVTASPAATILPSLTVPVLEEVATARAGMEFGEPTLVVTMAPVPNVGSRTPPEGRQRSSRTSSCGRKRAAARFPGAGAWRRRLFLNIGDLLGKPAAGHLPA